MRDFEEASLLMSVLALAGIAVMVDRPLEAACERFPEWFRPRGSSPCLTLACSLVPGPS